MKIYISADIEGVVGVVDGLECRAGNPEYEKARRYMTLEVEAAVQGALNYGAEEVFVKDAHGSGRNIIVDNLQEEVSIIRGWSGHPFKMMQELNPSFDAAILIGYHSGANADGNNLAHTINGGVIEEIRINGKPASEFMINTYTASYVDVPIIFVSGDQELIEEEVKELNLGIETLATKVGRGGSIISMPPKKAIRLIQNGVEEAMENLELIDIVELPDSFELEVDFTKNSYAETASHYPGMKKVMGNTVRGYFEDYFDVLRALLFLTKG